METPRHLNAPRNENNLDDQNLPERSSDRDSDQRKKADDREAEPVKINKEREGGFFRHIDTSFPLSGGETDQDLNRVLHSESEDEYKREPRENIELSDNDLHDPDDYRLNDGE